MTLSRNQEIELECEAKKGIGKSHTKWSPVCVANIQYDPVIKLNDKINDLGFEKKEAFVASCPKKVYELDPKSQKILIADRNSCIFCDECTKNLDHQGMNSETLVNIGHSENKFIFEVETNGSLSTETVFKNAIRELGNKILEVQFGISGRQLDQAFHFEYFMASTYDLFLFTVLTALFLLLLTYIRRILSSYSFTRFSWLLRSSRNNEDFTPVSQGKTPKEKKTESLQNGLKLDDKMEYSESEIKEGDFELDSLRMESTLGSAKNEWRDKHELFANDDSIPIDFSRVHDEHKENGDDEEENDDEEEENQFIWRLGCLIIMKLTSPILSTENISSSKNLIPHEEISNVSMLDKKTRLFINSAPKDNKEVRRFKVDFSSCEYHDDLKNYPNKKKSKMMGQDEYTDFNLSPTKIKKFKNSTRLYAHIKNTASKLGENFLKPMKKITFKSNEFGDDSISSEIQNYKTEKTEPSVSNLPATNNTSGMRSFVKAFSREKVSTNNFILKTETEGSLDTKERDYSRFDKSSTKFAKSKNTSLQKHLVKLKSVQEISVQKENPKIPSKEIGKLKSENEFLLEQIDFYRSENYDIKLELELMNQKIKMEEKENSKIRQKYETVATELSELRRFQGQIETFELLFPNSSIEEVLKRLQESEQKYLEMAKELMEAQDDLSKNTLKTQRRIEDYNEKTLELAKVRNNCEHEVEVLNKQLLAKDNEFTSMESYKESYLSLSNRLIGLFALWQRKNHVYTFKGSQEEISLRNPKEIMIALENLVEIATPESAQNYIRKFLVEFNMLQRKIFGDIERENPDISFVCSKILTEFQRIRAQNKKFLGKIRDSKRHNTLVKRETTELCQFFKDK